MLTGVSLDPTGVQILEHLMRPVLLEDEEIRGLIPEQPDLQRLHVVTQRRCFCFNKRTLAVDYEFDVEGVVRATLGEDDTSHCVYISYADGDLILLRVDSPLDARLLAGAIVQACEEAIRNVEPLSPCASADESAEAMLTTGADAWQIVVSREEVQSRDTTPVLAVLAPMLSNSRLARQCMEAVSVAVDGYNERAEELWQIPEVRMYLQRLDAQFPYWFFFLDKRAGGLFAIIRSVLPENLEGQRDQLDARLEGWWLPAMVSVARFARLADDEINVMVHRGLAYLQQGPGDSIMPPLPIREVSTGDQDGASPGSDIQDDTHVDEPKPLDPVEVLGDLADLLDDLPSVWWSGSEDGLVVYLWSVLRAAGVVKCATHLEHVRAIAMLLAVHRLMTVFYARAFGEGDPDEYEIPAGPSLSTSRETPQQC